MVVFVSVDAATIVRGCVAVSIVVFVDVAVVVDDTDTKIILFIGGCGAVVDCGFQHYRRSGILPFLAVSNLLD